MNEDVPALLLHETPIIPAIFKRIRCLLKGGHKYGDEERIELDPVDGMQRYSVSAVCEHCRHMKWKDELEGIAP